MNRRTFFKSLLSAVATVALAQEVLVARPVVAAVKGFQLEDFSHWGRTYSSVDCLVSGLQPLPYPSGSIYYLDVKYGPTTMFGGEPNEITQR